MTPEQLDEARAREASKRTWPSASFDNQCDFDDYAITAARLAREGWTPTDPDLIEAREVVARLLGEEGAHISAAHARRGCVDASDAVQAALA